MSAIGFLECRERGMDGASRRTYVIGWDRSVVEGSGECFRYSYSASEEVRTRSCDDALTRSLGKAKVDVEEIFLADSAQKYPNDKLCVTVWLRARSLG